jgi:hypothetical protein
MKMKKQILTSLLIIVCGLATFAQVNLYTYNFDSDTLGKLALQEGAPWTTWSAAPGGAEDPVVSATQSHSPSNAVYVVNNNDCVFNIGDLTTGRYIVEWQMFVETGKLGYFNLLSDFAGASSKWAFEAFIFNDSIHVNADGEGKAIVPFTWNTWVHLQFIVDLDDDFATLYMDSSEVVSYKWSKGALGTDNSLKLDGINFYGWNNNGTGTSGYYFDDFKIDSVAAPEAPFNLTAAINGADIDVDWTAPSTPPDLYKLSRNGSVVNSTTGLTYTDVGPWPDTYIYGVRAHYNGQGYSHSSNEDTATIAGGVTRNLVLFEKGTSMYCTYCPYAAMGFHDLIEVNHKDAVGIAYHPATGAFTDMYGTATTDVRLLYYGISAFPTIVADGILKIAGVYGTVSQYPYYLPLYNERIAAPSFQTLDVNIVETSTDNYTATIIVEETFKAYASGWKLHAALTESNIIQAWEGQTELDFVCRNMYPSANGTNLDFSTQSSDTITINFSTTGYVKNNCEFVVFIQHNATKLVTQTTKVDMSTIIGMQELQSQSVKMYPNPATEYFVLLSAGKGLAEIFDITGKMVSSTIITNPTQTFNITGLQKGIYLLKVSNDESSFTEKLIIQ